MKLSKIAIRYAKSLFHLAVERNIIEQVKENIDFIIDVFKKNRKFYTLLSSPLIQKEKKYNLLKTLFKNIIQKLTFDFLLFITQKRREQIILQICENFIRLYKEYKLIEPVEVITSHNLDEEGRKIILDFAQKIIGDPNKHIELIEKTDEKIIGGFILSIRDKWIDTSIRKKIKTLTHEFSQNPFVRTK